MFHIFFTVVPLQCGNKCKCHFDYHLNYNIYNCSTTSIASLHDPSNLTTITDVLDLSRNRIPELCGKQPYLRTIAELNLSQNAIHKICEETVIFMKTGVIVELNLANNSITSLPSALSNISSLQTVMLSGNKFICACEMTWMIQWLSRRTADGEIVVKDYQDVVCHSGKLVGKQIYKLTSNEIGCYPHKLSVGEKITIGTFRALIV